MTFHLQSTSSQEACDKLVQDVVSSCPVSDTIDSGRVNVVAGLVVIERG